MKIIVNQVPQEGLYLREQIKPADLDLETELIKFLSDISIEGKVNRITNALTVSLNIKAVLSAACSRCLEDFKWDFSKDVLFNFPLESTTTFIDISPDIREEIILDYPMKPLCRTDCKGLCPKCGKNKNEGGCNCGST